jgi:hypothetical protein
LTQNFKLSHSQVKISKEYPQKLRHIAYPQFHQISKMFCTTEIKKITPIALSYINKLNAQWRPAVNEHTTQSKSSDADRWERQD